jgi:hypothetical protein
LCWTQDGFRSQEFSGWVSFGVGVCASNGTKLLANICIRRKYFPVMCISHSALDGKLDVLDLGRVPFRASLRGWPTRDGVQTPKVSKPANTGGGDDDGVGGHGAAGDTDRIEWVYLGGDEAYGFTHDHNGPYWRAEWWAQVPISKRGTQLRDTRDGERRDDFHSADKGGPGAALPEPR